MFGVRNSTCTIQQQQGLDLRDKPIYGEPQTIPCSKTEKQSFTRADNQDVLITYAEYITDFRGLVKDKDKIDGRLIADVQEVFDIAGQYLYTKLVTLR